MKHIIEFPFAKDHTARVGIEAESGDEAMTKARTLFSTYQEVAREFFQALKDGNGGSLKPVLGFDVEERQLARLGVPTDMSENDVRALIAEALNLRHKTDAFMDDLAHGRAFKEKLPQASRSVTSLKFAGWVRAQAKESINPRPT